jgi:hypothetical protein
MAAAASVAQVLLPAVLLAALLAATVWGLARRSPAAFAGAWFFLILAPSSSVLPIVTEVAAEHRMYLPVAGVIALVVIGIFELARRAAGHAAAAPRRALAGAGLIAARRGDALRVDDARTQRRLPGLRSHLVRHDREAPAQRARAGTTTRRHC